MTQQIHYDFNKFEVHKEYLGDGWRYYVMVRMSKECAFQMRQFLALARAHPELVGQTGEDLLDQIEEELREVT